MLLSVPAVLRGGWGRTACTGEGPPLSGQGGCCGLRSAPSALAPVLKEVSTRVLPLSCWRCRGVCRDPRLCSESCPLSDRQMCECVHADVVWAPSRTGVAGLPFLLTCTVEL